MKGYEVLDDKKFQDIRSQSSYLATSRNVGLTAEAMHGKDYV
jgi:hypothetical protein